MSLPTPSSTQTRQEKGLRWDANYDRTFTVRGGNKALGDVLALDLTQSDAAVTSVEFGDESSIWSNVVDPDANAIGGLAPTIFVVGLAAIDDDLSGVCRPFGVVTSAFMQRASGNIDPGDYLVVDTSRNLNGGRSSNQVRIGFSMQALVTPTTRTLGRVFLNGFSAFPGGLEP